MIELDGLARRWGIQRATNRPQPSPRPRAVVSKFDPMGKNGSVIVWDLETVPDIGGDEGDEAGDNKLFIKKPRG